MAERKEKKSFSGECPYARASFLSKLTFWWLNPLFKIGFKNLLTTDDICDVLPEDGAGPLSDQLDRVWHKEWKQSESQKKEPSFFKAFLLTYKNECLVLGIFLFMSEAVRITQPYLIGRIIGYFQPDNELTIVEVYIYAVCLSLCTFLQLIFNPLYFFACHRLAMKMKAAITALIYRKILKISSLSLHKTTSGQIVNLMSTDVDKLTNCVETFNFAWMAPLEIAVVLYLLYRHIGVAAFFSMVVVISVVPLQFFMGWWFGKLRTKIGAKSDIRIHMMNEIIAGMRVIKMYCWEKPFSDLISKLRRDEVIEIWKATMAKALNISIYLSVPRLLCIVVFAAAWKLEVPLTTQLIYSTIGWIEALRLTVFLFLFFLIEDNTQLAASFNRIKRVLMLDEMNESTNEVQGLRVTSNTSSSVAMTMSNMTACWRVQHKSTDNDKSPEKKKLLQEEMLESFSMKNINLEIKKGELIAVIGPVGAGKTSLLLTLLGELPSSEGSIVVNGTLGYISQQPWVVSGTLRENILFGCDYDADKYKQVIEACALNQDIELMSNSDQTLVGERGLLLSGGQKARLTLGRTIYRDADIYLLDDPLSAVDTEVGRHLFNKCICEYLKGKTRILVTHQLQYLKAVDRIVVLKEGSVIDVGTYSDFLKKGTELSTLISAGHSDKDVHIVTEMEGEKYEAITKAETPQEKAEDIMSGRVSVHVYWSYLAAGFPLIFIPLLLVLNFATQITAVFADWDLARWAEAHDLLQSYFKSHDNTSSSYIQNNSDPCQYNCTSLSVSSLPQYQLWNVTSLPMMPQYNAVAIATPSMVLYHGKDKNEANTAIEYHMYRYTVVGVCYMVLTVIMSSAFFTMNVLASKRLHDRMFKFVLGAKTRFFDSNPVGRILNRFARDIGHMDDLLPRIFYCVFEIGLRLVFLTGTTCVINPWLIIPLLPIVIIVFLIRYYAIQTTRDMKRIEAVNRSPVYSHVSDTLIGLQSIRALRLTPEFIKSFDDHVNRHTISWFLYLTTYRWFSVRSLFAVVVYMNLVLFLSLILKDAVGVTGGLFGLSLSYCLLLTDPFEFYMRMTADLENSMTSVERVTAYTKVEQESTKGGDNPPPESWPHKANIKFIDVCLRYSPDSPMILKNINCSIRDKEKIGIVGRTGAGKSSLLASLFRLAEPEGRLLIDDIDVLHIGLHELRKKISVIPQDPVLFSGNLRRNLDPFDEYSDEQLWKSLEQVQMKEKIDGVPGKLYMEMAESGHNFSVGQRQLICLARAILRYNKILVLDEATANVDRKTDELIQETIRTRFKDCTVLTVAHRLHTVMDSDRVMVLDQGELKEFDHPHLLLQNDNSYFKKLVEQTGKGQAELLHKMAAESHVKHNGSFD